MIICLVVDCYNDRSNGTSMSAFRFGRELVRRGNEVRVVSTNTQKIDLQNEFIFGSEGEKIYYVKERYIPVVSEVSHWQNMVFGYPNEKILRSALAGSDIAHFFLPFRLEIVGVKMCRKLQIPYIGAFHLQPQHISYNIHLNFSLLNAYLFRRFFRAFYRYIHHIHCPSKLMCEEITNAKYGGKKYIISNGFGGIADSSDFSVFNDGLFHIFSVGRFSREKRQEKLIFAIAKSPYKERIKLHLHGIGPKETYLKSLCEKHLAHFECGFIDNATLLEQLRKAHLYVHPAEVESEAISCLEAVSLGVVPLIADSKISAANQFALNERSLFKTNDTKNLSQKIDFWFERFYENPSAFMRLRREYAASAKAYDISKSIDSIVSLYSEAISDFKANPKLFESFARI